VHARAAAQFPQPGVGLIVTAPGLFAKRLIGMARPLYATDPLAVDLDATVYAFDATTIDLCLSVYP